MTIELRIHEKVLKLITRAITKAINERLYQYYQENTFETNNHRGHLKGDMINQCLRELLVLEGVSLHPFRRHGWEGRLIIDRTHCITYCVMTQDTLNRIPKMARGWPHYLQTLLWAINGEYKTSYEQLSFIPKIESFDDDIYNKDFAMLLEGTIEDPQPWHHYIIAYSASGFEVKNVHIYFLDKAFNVIQERSLNEYIEPDSSLLFARISQDETAKATQDVHSLVNLKPGIKPPLINLEEEM